MPFGLGVLVLLSPFRKELKNRTQRSKQEVGLMKRDRDTEIDYSERRGPRTGILVEGILACSFYGL